MHQHIEKYVYDVIRRLPKNDRDRAKADLYAKINAMLPNEPSDDDVARVLNSLGSTVEMAEQYRSRKRFLISPALFDDYLRAMKIAGLILFSIILTVSLVTDILSIVQNPSISTLLAVIFLSFIKSLGIAAVASFTCVTVIFALIDYINHARHDKSWSIRDLPDIPRQVRRIPRRAVAVSMITSILLNVVWVIVMIRYPQYIAWYEKGRPVVALFHSNVLVTMVPFVIAVAVGSLMVSIGKLIYGYWNFPLAALNLLYNIGSAAYFVYFFHSGVFNEAFITKVATTLSVAKDVAISGFEKGVFILSAIFIIAMIWDAGDCFFRAFRNRNARMESIQ